MKLEDIMIDKTHQEILSEREVSDWLGLSEPTLFRHRRNGTGPQFIQLSERRIGYRRKDVDDWLKARERQPLNSTLSSPITA
jgi:predicted DNA-binding transcriptional regulator AlpA